jgi:predicted Zn-ribbon and HTH transcriptional regulator
MRQYLKLTALGIVLIAPVSTTIAASKSPKLARKASPSGQYLWVDPANCRSCQWRGDTGQRI